MKIFVRIILLLFIMLASDLHARLVPPPGSSVEQVMYRNAAYSSQKGGDLTLVRPVEDRLGAAQEKNCENMFGHIALPLGMLERLVVPHSNGVAREYNVPLATTEGALIASINRGAKALRSCDVNISHEYIGVTRAPVLQVASSEQVALLRSWIDQHRDDLCAVGEKTSGHLKVIGWSYEQESISGFHRKGWNDLLCLMSDSTNNHLFLRINFDTDKAMGMNMATIASRAMVDYIIAHTPASWQVTCPALSSNVCTDKKVSAVNQEKGRGHRVCIKAFVPNEVINTVLKTTREAMFSTWQAKYDVGSRVAGMLSKNAHVANIAAALYIALGQDPAHVVEASQAVLEMHERESGFTLTFCMPAIMVGVVGGGTALPAQRQLIEYLGLKKSGLHECAALSQVVALACLAGELSVLAALSARQLTRAHQVLAR